MVEASAAPNCWMLRLSPSSRFSCAALRRLRFSSAWAVRMMLSCSWVAIGVFPRDSRSDVAEQERLDARPDPLHGGFDGGASPGQILPVRAPEAGPDGDGAGIVPDLDRRVGTG